MKRMPGFDDNSTATKSRRQGPPLRREGASWELTITKGPDAGRVHVLDGRSPPRVLVGTSPACEVRVTDPLVSRRHLAIEIGGPFLRVLDQGSTNGTFLHGTQVVEVLLRGGEHLALGDTTLSIKTADAPSEPTTRAIKFGRLLGASEEMRRLYPKATMLAQTQVPVIIEGETGTGKELLAEAIHETSGRARAPFVVFDCSSVSPTLLESELFGHEKGAFTGAVALRKGVFEEAHTGTLLIDEIAELDLGLQAKLLRALETGAIKRIGGSRWINVDVRIIAATRRDLDLEVEHGRFRDDLFFRLAVGRIELPPLRRRHGDLPLLVEHFWRMLGGDPFAIPPELMERFEAYTWPGNVRELANAVAQQLAVGETELGLTSSPKAPSVEPFDDVLGEAFALPFPHAKAKVLAEFERRYVEHLVAKHGSVARAAAASGLARRYFQLLRARHAQAK
jgi:DNA-binding NtrC family response regulator